MAISHICHNCGFDLAHTCTTIDPHYHLPIVQCPNCQTHQVRRKHPIIQRWRQIRRGICTSFHLTFRIGLGILLGIAMYWWTDDLITQAGLTIEHYATEFPKILRMGFPTTGRQWDMLFPDYILHILTWLSISIIGGIYITSIMRHWKRPIAWTAWLLFLLILISDQIIIDSVRYTYESLFTNHPKHTPANDIHNWVRNAEGVLLTFAVSFCGVPLGWAFNRAATNLKNRRFRKRRRKIRKRKQSG